MAMTVSSMSASGVTTHGRSTDVWGRRNIGLYRLTPEDTAFASGGESFDPVAYGFKGPVAAVFLSIRAVAASAGMKAQYDHVNKKVQIFDYDSESTTDLSTVLIDAIVIGE